jgi:hypothetical protein
MNVNHINPTDFKSGGGFVRVLSTDINMINWIVERLEQTRELTKVGEVRRRGGTNELYKGTNISLLCVSYEIDSTGEEVFKLYCKTKNLKSLIELKNEINLFYQNMPLLKQITNEFDLIGAPWPLRVMLEKYRDSSDPIKKRMWDFQKELIDKGYELNAKL